MWCLALLLGLSACRAKGCSKPVGPTLHCAAHANDNPDETCAELASGTCDNFVNALRWTSYACVYKDRETCVAVYKAECLRSLSLRGTGVTVATVWGTIQMRKPRGDEPEPELDSSCKVEGKLAGDQSCVADIQCNNGYCLVNSTTHCGLCKRYLSKGDSCTDPDQHCDYREDLTCVSGRCRKETKKGLNEACEHSYDCDWEAFCFSGTCLPTKASGEPCREDDECTDLRQVCQHGRCQQREYVRESEPCGSSEECTPGLTCKGAAVQARRTGRRM